MTTHTDRAARLAELEAQITYRQAKIADLEGRRLSAAEQANTPPNVLAKGYDPLKRAEMRQRVEDIDAQIDDIAGELPYLVNEARELRHQVNGHAQRIRDALHTLGDFASYFAQERHYRLDFQPSGELDHAIRSVLVAAELLRAEGHDVPAEMVIRLPLRPLIAPTVTPITWPAQDLGDEAEDDGEEAEDAENEPAIAA